MLKNYIKTAWRNLLKNKFYSLINIAGLTAGLAIGILILLWVQDELSFDNFHKQGPDIYQLAHYGGTGSSRQIYVIDVAPIGPLAKRQLPEVKDQVRITGNYDYSLFKYGEKVFGDEKVVYTDPSFFSMFDFRLTSGNRRDAPKALAAAEKQFKQYNGEYPFGYAFLDEIFDSLYQGEQREGTLFTEFACIAIFISCLGLLGLAAYTAQVRTREIGVRKVLGASVTGIVGLLAQDFIKLVIISILIATPIAWFAMYKWLEDYAYRINISWAVFAIAGTLAILIAFITISFQTVRAALINPVKSLRSE